MRGTADDGARVCAAALVVVPDLWLPLSEEQDTAPVERRPWRASRSEKHGALPLITPWPTMFDAVCVPWPPIAGS